MVCLLNQPFIDESLIDLAGLTDHHSMTSHGHLI